MTVINYWFKQMFIHHASSQKQKNNSIPTDRCILVNKPSTMSNVDSIHCDDDVKKPIEMKLLKKDIIVLDKFQTCFIDCTCQCEVKMSFFFK